MEQGNVVQSKELRQLQATQRKALIVCVTGFLMTAFGILGLLSQASDPGAEEYTEARKWHLQAAEPGYAQAQENYAKARNWYLRAAEQGHAGAQFSLGLLCAEGLGGPQDYAEAWKWYLKAAEQGHAGAQNNLGLLYNFGNGVAWDYVEARKWYLKAAEQGHADAQNNLGALYLTGVEARNWYLKAAEQGHARAQDNLGALYSNAEGIEQDYAMAFAWHDSAAALGYAPARKHRDAAAAKLGPDSLAEAQELAKEYYKRYVEPFQRDAASKRLLAP